MIKRIDAWLKVQFDCITARMSTLEIKNPRHQAIALVALSFLVAVILEVIGFSINR